MSAEFPFPELRFKGQLRPAQQEVIDLARAQLEAGERHLHIVAPPGAGKTVLGLYFWAHCVRQPALVLSPNSAIQAQWAARTALFDGIAANTVNTESGQAGLLTSLTYQAVTLPQRGDSNLDQQALQLWSDNLIANNQAEDPIEAETWLNDLRQHNPDYYQERLGLYRKQARELAAADSSSLHTLHQSAQNALTALRERGVGLVILDECHHLLGHWGRVLADAHDFLAQPIILGLTATPPERQGKHREDIARYDALLGEIDYEVPVPAVVKDGFLAPYQDLAYFVRPLDSELHFIANADDQLHVLVKQLCTERPDGLALPAWVSTTLAELRLPVGTQKDWLSFERRDPQFALAARLFLQQHSLPLPDGVPEPAIDENVAEIPELGWLVPVLDRYVRHALRRSPQASEQNLAEQTIARLRLLGVQITDTGAQACASPVGRVLAYSRAKTAALIPILKTEFAVLGEHIRACVVADYEKTSATRAEVEHLLDDEAGGAIAAFRAVLSDPLTDQLDPILVTGSSVLVDDDLAPKFDQAAQDWLKQRGYEVTLSFGEEDGFHSVNGQGRDWCPRVYVEMVTDLFQSGLSKCLVGTRGLLGEGWDANKINVLVDLTTVTTSMTVNQLRGRSIRLDPQQPEKIANNWDVVCIAPEFSKGLDDYQRFIAKHKTLFGVTDDGVIEKGVGHVHPAFTELKPEGLEGSVALLNEDMLGRAGRRPEARQLWRIGEPYRGEPVRTLEIAPSVAGGGGFPPFVGSQETWNTHSLALAIGQAVLGALIEAQLLHASPQLRDNERAGGYVRVFLENADEQDHVLFTNALHQALGPLHRPRYVIPRYVDQVDETFFSRLLPEILAKYLRKRRRERVMLHAVPDVLGKKKELAAIYQTHWNQHVSPGEAVYAHHGAGEEVLIKARQQGQTPLASLHDKEIFL